MPLHELNYENFFLGNAAEFWIASQVYFNGFEASKLSPDFGIDLLITNAARSKFKDEALSSRLLQIKSSFLVAGEAKIHVDPNELDYLASRAELATVFCFFTPVIEGHPQSFDRGDFEPWRESLDAQIDQMNYDAHFHVNKRTNGCLSAFDFKGFSFDYFWLNSVQLARSIEEHFWTDSKFQGKSVKTLSVIKHDAQILIQKNSEQCMLIGEVQNLYYWLNNNKSSYKLSCGAFIFDHY